MSLWGVLPRGVAGSFVVPQGEVRGAFHTRCVEAQPAAKLASGAGDEGADGERTELERESGCGGRVVELGSAEPGARGEEGDHEERLRDALRVVRAAPPDDPERRFSARERGADDDAHIRSLSERGQPEPEIHQVKEAGRHEETKRQRGQEGERAGLGGKATSSRH